MASIIVVKKKIMIDLLFLIEDKTGDLKQFREDLNKLDMSEVEEKVQDCLSKYDKNFMCFNLGVAFSWFINDCTIDESNVSIAVLDDLYDTFDIKDPDDLRGETYENS